MLKTTHLIFGMVAAAALALTAGTARAGGAEAYAAEAEAVLQELRGAMLREMQAAMAMGPAAAIGVCRHLAPEISREIEKRTGWEIRRVALKVRDPDNRANAEERSLLMGYEIKLAAGQAPDLLRTLRVTPRGDEVEIHFMQAVPMLDGCTACHGTAIDPATAAEIKRLYPEDAAVGYATGDIRGAFSLYKTVGAEAFRKAEAAPKRDDLKAMGYAPRDRPGAKGSAVAGLAVFQARCQSCHGPADLAGHVFPKGGGADAATAEAEAAFCRKLETHGYTDEKSDCDILAFLTDLALFLAKSGSGK